MLLKNRKLSDINYNLKAFLYANHVSFDDIGKKANVSGKTIWRRLNSSELSESETDEIKAIAEQIINERGDNN